MNKTKAELEETRLQLLEQLKKDRAVADERLQEQKAAGDINTPLLSQGAKRTRPTDAGGNEVSHVECAAERYSPDTICRNCWEASPAEDLIAPCACGGSQRWVHRACLNEWRAMSPREDSFWMCDVCGVEYLLEEERTHALWWSYAKASMKLLRDTILLLALCQLVVLAIWGIGTLLHLEELSMPSGYSLLPSGLSTNVHNFLASYYIFFALVGLCTITVLVVLILLKCMDEFDNYCMRPGCTHHTYDFNRGPFYYYGNIWFSSPSPSYYHHHGYGRHHYHGHYHGHYYYDNCCSTCLECSFISVDCCSGNGCGGSDNECCKKILAIIFIVLMIIGAIVSVVLFAVFLYKVGRKHFSHIWRESEAKQLVVVDLSKDVV
eukprot:TRINITY_DN21036_c0_g1_i1.p1 TRINITY_DN21036_c0_g1~~TRINITY_DN21036_c0_g1_i1.p1  ORF type:complete len:385 (-),score=55.57 TRINITY_DN21036_c0_g1_i1:82-1215(-)